MLTVVSVSMGGDGGPSGVTVSAAQRRQARMPFFAGLTRGLSA
ncbi:hypothetical protein [Mycobacterium gordonae]|nr:hypothetical protein [Mycobacterium gordonae]